MSEMRDERGSVREVAEPGCAGPGSLIRHRYEIMMNALKPFGACKKTLP